MDSILLYVKLEKRLSQLFVQWNNFIVLIEEYSTENHSVVSNRGDLFSVEEQAKSNGVIPKKEDNF